MLGNGQGRIGGNNFLEDGIDWWWEKKEKQLPVSRSGMNRYL